PTGEPNVAVIGCGPIGLLLVAALRRRGAVRIVATDTLSHRTEKALVVGADDAPVATEANDEIDSLQASVPGGFDVVFDAAGTDSAMRTALSAVRPGGRVILVGIPPGDRTSFTASLARRKEVTLALCRRMLPCDLLRAVELAGEGSIDLESLVSHRFSLSSAGEAFSMLIQRGGLKVLVKP
ncbi:MAG TPA: zinc-binding dehydrogenase, partial [Acidimicrobiia bacterium]